MGLVTEVTIGSFLGETSLLAGNWQQAGKHILYKI
jgi:hypothetical protein